MGRLLILLAVIAIVGFYPQNPGSMEPPWIPNYPHVIMVGPGYQYVLNKPGGIITKEDLDEHSVPEQIRGYSR